MENMEKYRVFEVVEVKGQETMGYRWVSCSLEHDEPTIGARTRYATEYRNTPLHVNKGRVSCMDGGGRMYLKVNVNRKEW